MGSYGRGDSEDGAEQIENAAELKFGLERDLQIALQGKEKSVEGYRFDITAEDEKGRVVIIELKAGSANKEAVAQLLSYIGALMETGERREIRGILVAHEYDRAAKLAAKPILNITLMAYSFQFTFEVA